MATREEMIAASKKRFGQKWEPLDLSTPEAAIRTYGADNWNTSCWNPDSGCSVHNKEIDHLTKQFDHIMGHDGQGGTILARNGTNQEWMRETIDKAEATRQYAAARHVATEKWAAVAAPDQMRTVALCREQNASWDEKVRELEARAVEIDGGMQSGRFRTKSAGLFGGSRSSGSCSTGGGPLGALPKPVLFAILAGCIAGIAMLGMGNSGGKSGGGGSSYSQGRR
jgi:hypothetical protein